MAKGIYCIKNIVNGKMYIGLTSNVDSRYKSHEYLLKNNRHGNSHLQGAFNKYGKNNFCYSILEITENLHEREIFWINFFGGTTGNKLYNKSTGGETGFKFSKDTKEKLTKIRTGKIQSKEHIRNRVESCKGKMSWSETQRKHMSNLFKGRRLTEETKQKISDTKKGKKISESARLKLVGKGNKGVSQYTFAGKLVNKYPSAKIAGIELGFWKSDITQNCMGKRKTVKGFIFKYTTTK